MAFERKEILVYAHWDRIEDPFLMGSLYATPSRGKEIFSFEYDKEWLFRNHCPFSPDCAV